MGRTGRRPGASGTRERIASAATRGFAASGFDGASIRSIARQAGVDPALVRQALLGGFAASRVLEVHGERILASNYKPGFRANLYAKDLRIASNTLAEFGTPAPVSSAVHQLVEAQVAAGEGEDDYSALARVVFKLAGLN